MTPLPLPHAPRVLVVALQRLGDVLLSTPLVRSIKRAYPSAKIDALVFSGTEGMLAGNPDLSGVIAIAHRPGFTETFKLVRRLARRYDVAVSTQSGDRPTIMARIAGRACLGPVETSGLGATVKRLLLSRSFPRGLGDHRIIEMLRLADLLGITRVAEVVCPTGATDAGLKLKEPYAVVHAAPMFQYKRWTSDGWRGLAERLRDRGLATVVTGAPADRSYLDVIWADSGAIRLDGRLEWPDLSSVIAAATVYVGPDTGITHLAAATGAPTVALFGPTDPRHWGPWPRGGLDIPWAASGAIQRRGNVWLVQNPAPCLPCGLEGCERRRVSHSRCLDELTLDRVIAAVDQALAARPPASG